MGDQNTSTEHSSCNAKKLMWWTTLIVAVLAVPAFGYIVVSAIPIKGIGEIVVFMLACWFCTFLGMKLMQMPNMSEKFGKKD